MSTLLKIHLVKVQASPVRMSRGMIGFNDHTGVHEETYCGKLMKPKFTTSKFYKATCDECLKNHKLATVTTNTNKN